MDFAVHLLVLFSLNSVLVAGLGIVVGLGGVIALNAGAFTAIGAYTYGITTAHLGWPPLLAFLVAVSAGLLVGWLLSAALTQLVGEDLVLGVLAVQLVITSLAANLDGLTGGIYGLPNIVRIGSGASVEATVAVTLIGCMVILLPLAALYRSPFARLLRGTRDAPVDAMLLGRAIPLAQRSAFVCAATAGAAAGALTASYMTYIDPTTTDVSVSVSVLAAVIIGGAGRFVGALAGAAVITLLPEALRLLPITSATAPAIQQLIFGSLLIVCMLRRPQGLLGEYGFREAA